MRTIWALICAMALLAACQTEEAPQPQETGGAASREPTRDDRAATSESPDLEQRRAAREALARIEPERVPEESAEPVTGEVPEPVLDKIRADLASRISAESGDIGIVRAEAVTWNDGSLGCPQPGMMYTQALVPGYWVVLKYQDELYDYRASERGFFVLCERPVPAVPLPAGASEPPAE